MTLMLAALSLAACAGGAPSAERGMMAPGERIHVDPVQALVLFDEGGGFNGRDVMAVPAAGNVTVVEFFQRHCEMCPASAAALEREVWRGGDAGFQVVAVSKDSSWEEGLEAVKELGSAVTYPVVYDGTNELRGMFRVDAVPRVFVVDGRGEVRYMTVSAAGKGEEIRRVAERLSREK